MTKIFDPEITPGEWVLNSDEDSLGGIRSCCSSESGSSHLYFYEDGDQIAIQAIPEMLAVIKCLNKVMSINYSFDLLKIGDLEGELTEAIKNLNEKHGSEK